MPEVSPSEPHPTYLGLPTYLSTPLALSASELPELAADVAIIGAPIDMGVRNRPGARFGPRVIRQAAYFGSDHHQVYHMGLDVYPLEVLKVVDFGDANCPPSSLELSHKAVAEKVAEALGAGAIPAGITHIKLPGPK